MANLYYDVRVDIQKDIVIDSGLRFTQGDSKVIYLRLAVMNGGVKFDASNTTPSVNFVKPDGTYVVGTPIASGDFWIYQFLGNELQKAGKVLCDIKFTYESGRVSSSKFTFIVEKDTTISGAEASSSYIAPMEELLGEMKNYKNQGYSLAEAAEKSSVNATTEADRAKNEADKAAAIVGIGIATTTQAGIVKPDGISITVDDDGTIHSGSASPDNMKKSEYATRGILGTVDKATQLVDVTNSKTADTVLLANLTDDGSGLKYKGSEIGGKVAIDDVTIKEGTDGKLKVADTITAKLSQVGEQILGVISGDTVTFTNATYIGGTDDYLLDPYVSDTDRFLVSQSISGHTLTIVCDDTVKSDSVAVCMAFKKGV